MHGLCKGALGPVFTAGYWADLGAMGDSLKSMWSLASGFYDIHWLAIAA